MTEPTSPMSETTEKPTAWTNTANLAVLKEQQPLYYAVMFRENTPEFNVPLYDAAALSAAEARGREAAAKWHDTAADNFRQVSIKYQGTHLDNMATKALARHVMHEQSAAAIRVGANYCSGCRAKILRSEASK